MQQYGITESLLQRAFLESAEGQAELCWTLDMPVTVGFYRDLHKYLQKWPLSRSASKATVGRFYVMIDYNFQRQRISSRPDNIYSFIQRVADSSKPQSELMSYGADHTVKHLQSVVSGYQNDLEVMSEKVSEHQQVVQDIKSQLEVARTELNSTKHVLSDVTKKLKTTTNQRDSARKHVQTTQQKLEATIMDAVYYEEEILSENENLSDLVQSLQMERSTASEHFGEFQTKEIGGAYTTAIRELYYTLLANQMPPNKIATTIKSILKSFLPSLDVDNMKLPGESCASYMRRQELTTVNLAHKATCLLDKAQYSLLNLNCDGTTLAQKKVQGAAISGMTLSVNAIPDGSADSMIDDISKELLKLREIAHALQLPNADKINWTLIQSSSSDSASTQKWFNRIVEEKREEDMKRFGPACKCPDVIELVENFCCMHLGVNLRKAFFDGIKVAESNPVCDVLVHEFCKLLGKHGGKHGAPEYAHGAVAFPD